MPKSLAISINLGTGYSGLSLYAQLIRTNGENITEFLSDGFYEVGNGFYIWEYALFPDNFRGGVKFYNQSDTSKVLIFKDITTEESVGCCSNEECNGEVGSTFDITYSDQPNLNFYALLFSAEDSTKAWNPSTNTFETYSLSTHSSFSMTLVQDSNRLGWYSYSIIDIKNIPFVIGNQYYFIEVWKKINSTPDRTTDINTGTLRVCWGKEIGDWMEIAKNVWEYGTRTLTDFQGITPKQIWEYSTRTLTEGGSCDYAELEKSILSAIKISTGLTLAELEKVNKELGDSISKTFSLLQTCCSSRVSIPPKVQNPRIGQKGSSSSGSNIKFGQ